MKSILIFISILSLCACATNPTTGKVSVSAAKFGQDASAFANSPAGQALTAALVGASVNAVINVGSQYATTGKIDSRQIVQAALDGSASQLRTVTTANQTAVTTAMTQGSGLSTVSKVTGPIVASSVQAQVATGTAPPVAVQNAAAVVNAVAEIVPNMPAVQPAPSAAPSAP